MTKCKKLSVTLLEIESVQREQSGWAAKAQRLAWPRVQLSGNRVELMLGESAQVAVLRQILPLPQQPVDVFVNPPAIKGYADLAA